MHKQLQTCFSVEYIYLSISRGQRRLNQTSVELGHGWMMTSGQFLLVNLTPGTPFTNIPAWISNHFNDKVWDEIIYTFPTFNGATVEVCEWISDFIPHFIIEVISYPFWDWSYSTLVKWSHGVIAVLSTKHAQDPCGFGISMTIAKLCGVVQSMGIVDTLCNIYRMHKNGSELFFFTGHRKSEQHITHCLYCFIVIRLKKSSAAPSHVCCDLNMSTDLDKWLPSGDDIFKYISWKKVRAMVVWLKLHWNMFLLTHLPRVPHICVSELDLGSGNGLSPVRRQAITWPNAAILLIGALGTNISEIWIKIQNFSFMKMHPKISSAKRRQFCPGGDELKHFHWFE